VVFLLTGAGMGADAGLSTYRGSKQTAFWRNKENEDLFAKYKVTYTGLADPDVFEDQPQIAVGFHVFKERLYRDTAPHVGYELIHKIIPAKKRLLYCHQ
jgi:NAD-dependent SIR2 family protein deacetylase